MRGNGSHEGQQKDKDNDRKTKHWDAGHAAFSCDPVGMGGRRIRTVRAILFAGGQFVNVKEIARWRFERTADSSCLAAPRVGMTTFLSSASFRESKFRFDTSELPGETAGPTRANVPARTADLALREGRLV